MPTLDEITQGIKNYYELVFRRQPTDEELKNEVNEYLRKEGKTMTYAKLRPDLARRGLSISNQLIENSPSLDHYDLLNAEVITGRFYFKFDECEGLEVLRIRDGRIALCDSIDLEFYENYEYSKNKGELC